MITFVLSGGGNRGPLQVGALRVLLESGIVPEMIVGSSAGAINGAFLALNPVTEQCDEMARLWNRAGKHKLIAASPLQFVKQFALGADHISDNQLLKRYARARMGDGTTTFGALKIPLFVTIGHLRTHTLYVYGDDPSADVVEAIATSSAVPGFFPPTKHKGELFIDGGSLINLPIMLAISRGATEIYALDIAYDLRAKRSFEGVLKIGEHASRPILYSRNIEQLQKGIATPGITIHHIPFYEFPDVNLGDFSKTDAMIASGARDMRDYLRSPAPNRVRGMHKFGEHELPEGPAGTRPFLEHA